MTVYSDTTELRKSRRPLVQNPLSVLLQNLGTGDFPEPLRLIGVRVDKLKDLIWEMAANWESLHPQESPRVDPAYRARFNRAWSEHRQIYAHVLHTRGRVESVSC
jgi:hypothetical protein